MSIGERGRVFAADGRDIDLTPPPSFLRVAGKKDSSPDPGVGEDRGEGGNRLGLTKRSRMTGTGSGGFVSVETLYSVSRDSFLRMSFNRACLSDTFSERIVCIVIQFCIIIKAVMIYRAYALSRNKKLNRKPFCG